MNKLLSHTARNMIKFSNPNRMLLLQTSSTARAIVNAYVLNRPIDLDVEYLKIRVAPVHKEVISS